MIFKSDKIRILQMLQRGETIPNSETDSFILFDLIADGMVSIAEKPFGINITHFGFKELSEYDSILQVSINYQLCEKPYGDA